MRAQFNGLKEFIDLLAERVAELEAQNANLTQQLAALPTMQQVLDLIAAQAAATWTAWPPCRRPGPKTRPTAPSSTRRGTRSMKSWAG